MKERIKIVFKLSLVIFSLSFLLFKVIMPQYRTTYTGAVVDKYERLQEIQEPKIILVGGSNVAFGVDSLKLEDAFGMPVVNMGLNAGLGQAFHSELIKEEISEGDIVIIMPEDYGEQTTDIKNYPLAWTALEDNLQLWSVLKTQDYLEMVKAFPTYFSRAKEKFLWGTDAPNDERDCYQAEAFNDHGDVVYPKTECIMSEGDYDDFAHIKLSEEMKDYWNELNEYIKEKDAVLYMSCPPVLDEILSSDMGKLQEDLDTELDCPMISDLSDYTYPLAYFYDSSVHLNDIGKEVRTEQLIEDLREVM